MSGLPNRPPDLMALPEIESRLQAIQNEVLEMIAYSEPLKIVATLLCERIEEIAPESVCSILSVDDDGRLHPVASPSLPTSYTDLLDGIAIGPEVGSCGTAAHRGQPVEVTDIASDPLWAKYRHLVEPLGFKACWASPIKARGGRVIGTFALYYRTNRGPLLGERQAVDAFVRLAAIAIEQAEIHARNYRLAYFDTLTGLPNRFHADVLMKRKLEEHAGWGLLLIDIDNLKIINDTLGHPVGDELIRQVASRIETAAHPGTACRIGGDEFAAVVGGSEADDILRSTARRILASMQPPFEFNGHTIFPSVTIGGVLFGKDASDLDTLRQNADLALYHSKESGRSRFIEFNQGLRTTMTRRIQRTREVEVALNGGRIVPHYQPVVRLDTREIVGLEALARLRAPDGTYTAAGYFQEAMKEARIARRLTETMLAQVAADVRFWIDSGIPFQHVGINVTGGDFQDDDLADHISEAFGREGVPLKHIVLEVTETVFVGGSDNIVAGAVERLRSRGLRVALDDFGTGYASLTHLLTFPVDIIKIDKCFVDRLVDGSASGVIVDAMIDIAKKLHMPIVAEGVETVAQADALQALGCTLGQGFLFYRAAAFDETTSRLFANAQGLTRSETRSKRSVA